MGRGEDVVKDAAKAKVLRCRSPSVFKVQRKTGATQAGEQERIVGNEGKGVIGPHHVAHS